MSNILLFNKPFQVLTQFTTDDDKDTLARYIKLPNFYAAGRLDYDSEGLLILTDDGQVQHQLANPKFKLEKTYWAQVEGDITDEALNQLASGVELKDGLTRPAITRRIETPTIWDRVPPIRERKNIPTSWVELKITEGKNRQVRRMTAAVGFPTLRLVRYAIGSYTLGSLQPGQYEQGTIELKSSPAKNRHPQQKDSRGSANHRDQKNKRSHPKKTSQ
jgi:23S rRNA pseudouridine2457 synthase